MPRENKAPRRRPPDLQKRPPPARAPAEAGVRGAAGPKAHCQFRERPEGTGMGRSALKLDVWPFGYSFLFSFFFFNGKGSQEVGGGCRTPGRQTEEALCPLSPVPPTHLLQKERVRREREKGDRPPG